MAMEAMLSEFDYFTPTVLQSSIVSEYDDVLAMTNAVGQVGNALGTFEFNIPGANDLYRDLNNTFLMLKLKVVDAAGANYGNNVVLAPANLTLHSLFSSVTVTLCGKEITDKDSMYPYRAYLETLLTYEPDVLKSRAVAEGWSKDKTGLMNHITLAVQQNQPDPNPGFVARQLMIRGSRTFTLIGRPHLDLFHQNLDLPPSCGMTLKFTPAPVTFSFIGDNANVGSRVMLMGAKLYVRTKRVCPELVLAHKEMLQKCNIRMPHNRVTVTRHGIPQGFISNTVALNFPSKLPKRIFIGFVTNAACTGAIDENPFNFQNFGMTDLHVLVNGVQMPSDSLETNYATGDYQRAYLSTLAALGLDNDNRAIYLSPEEFAVGFNLHGFKIAPGPIDGTVFCSSNSIGGISVYVQFAQALAAAVDMIVFAETPAVLEIDKLSAVTIV